MEFPEVLDHPNEIADGLGSPPGALRVGLRERQHDSKTRYLANIAINSANRNPRAVMRYAQQAAAEGATREEVLSAVGTSVHISGLADVEGCSSAAVEGYELSQRG